MLRGPSVFPPRDAGDMTPAAGRPVHSRATGAGDVGHRFTRSSGASNTEESTVTPVDRSPAGRPRAGRAAAPACAAGAAKAARAPGAARATRAAAAVGALVLAAGCGTGAGAASTTPGARTPSASAAGQQATGTMLDAATMHDVAVTFDEAEYDAMVETFRSTGDKEWISATVTIDGESFEDVGLRLKGNSSLQGLRGEDGEGDGVAAPVAGGGPGAEVSADAPESLPWLIRLDKFVDGQDLDGLTEVVVRSNRSATSLNEAVALELVGLAGLATQQSAASRFSVNGSDEVLRLLVENPGDDWSTAALDPDVLLYKAEAGGDYSYRGDDPEAYTDVFDQEAGEEDLGPLVAFLAFLDEADDATFAAELGEHLDVEAFARYLALQELLANDDDIDGPGNNSYLAYDPSTGLMTVVTWDLNLAFGGLGGFGGMTGAPGGGRVGDGERPTPPDGVPPGDGWAPGSGFVPPDGATSPDGAVPPDDAGWAGGPGGGGPGGLGGSNVLVERFLADDAFAAAYEAALEELTAELYGSGAATAVLERWTTVLEEGAGDLVDDATLAEEADAVAQHFTTDAASGASAAPTTPIDEETT